MNTRTKQPSRTTFLFRFDSTPYPIICILKITNTAQKHVILFCKTATNSPPSLLSHYYRTLNTRLYSSPPPPRNNVENTRKRNFSEAPPPSGQQYAATQTPLSHQTNGSTLRGIYPGRLLLLWCPEAICHIFHFLFPRARFTAVSSAASKNKAKKQKTKLRFEFFFSSKPILPPQRALHAQPPHPQLV